MFFKNIAVAPNDPIFGLDIAYNNDKKPNKVNLGVGVYNDNDNKVSILSTVIEAEKYLLEYEKTKNYNPITGNEIYNNETKKLVFGEDSHLIKEERVYTAQTIGGTGALRIAGEFLKKHVSAKRIWISNPTWANHIAIFKYIGFEIKEYKYYNEIDKSLDWNGLLNSLEEVEKGDIILLHGCCHNPTGVDLNKEQWKELSKFLVTKNVIPLFDIAYQGFANSLDEDAFGIRLFAQEHKEFIVCNSYSKNFALYNERVGAINIVGANKEYTFAAYTQIRSIIRVLYSSSANHGAAVVAHILSNKELKQKWIKEVEEMCIRIKSMRTSLYNKLLALGIDFEFINNQNGMFSFTGLTKEQIQILIDKYSIYAVSSGRFNIAGLTTNNIDYVAHSISEVLKSK